MSDCLEDYLVKALADFQLDTAGSSALDSLAASFSGLTRTVGETDSEFRRWIQHVLAVDEDRLFAQQVEAILNHWDKEDDQDRCSRDEVGVQPPQEEQG